jgi:YHS domain-containing protein
MFNKSRAVSLFVALAFVFVLAGAAAQQSPAPQKTAKENPQETVTCPVSGETINKAEAKISWEYKGKTYYFCCEGCKAKFMKDPEQYLQKKPEGQAEAKAAYVCPMCKDVKSDKPGKCPHCGMDLVKMEPGKDVMIKRMPMEGRMHGQGMKMHHGWMGHGMMGGQGMGCMMKGGCPMMMKDVELKVENTKDGVTLILTSKNPETVKMIQDHLAKMKEGCKGKEGCMGAKKEEPKKDETKKDNVKK